VWRQEPRLLLQGRLPVGSLRLPVGSLRLPVGSLRLLVRRLPVDSRWWLESRLRVGSLWLLEMRLPVANLGLLNWLRVGRLRGNLLPVDRLLLMDGLAIARMWWHWLPIGLLWWHWLLWWHAVVLWLPEGRLLLWWWWWLWVLPVGVWVIRLCSFSIWLFFGTVVMMCDLHSSFRGS
jgi:hypothetical protein